MDEKERVVFEPITITEYISACPSCKHLDRENPTKCKAFPDGIPREVTSGKVPHVDNIEGDHGYRYEPMDKKYDFVQTYGLKRRRPLTD